MINVLYVDDEPLLLSLGKTFLERSQSISVDTAASVNQALEMLEQHSYDAIVSDYQMPLTDGIEFLRQVRTEWGQLPFILFTGRGREEVVIDALNNGADYYLQKGGEPKSQFAELEHNIRLAIERKRTRDELQQSRQRMADLIDHLPDATFAVDLDGNVIVWNQTMEFITGVPADKILGTGNFSYAIPFYGTRRPLLLSHFLGHINDIRKYYPNYADSGNRLISEGFFPKVNGGKGAHLWFVASPLYDTKGNIVGAIQSIRDITDRKNIEKNLMETNEELHAAYEQLSATEEELRQNYDELLVMEKNLRESEQRYRNVIEDQTEFICRFTPEGTHIFVNEAYCRYFGVKRGDITGKKFAPKIPPAESENVRSHLASLTRDHPVATITHRIIMPDGEIRWQQWSDRAIFNTDGTVREYQSVGRDVTDLKTTEEELLHKNEELHAAYEQLAATEEELRQNYDELSQMEKTLRENEEKYRNVVEDQTEFICRFTPEGTHIFVNDAYCRYFGKDRTEIINRTFQPEIPKEDQEMVREFFRTLSKTNPVGSITHRIIMPDGKTRWQQWSDRVIFNPDGTVREYQSVGRDVTDLKTTEEELLRKNEELNAAYEQLAATEEELRQNYDELSQMEKTLRENEEKYRNVVEDQTEFISRFTPKGEHIFVNEAYCRYFGKSRADIINNTFRPDIPEADRKKVEAFFRSLTKKNPFASITHRIIMPNGQTRWQQWSDRAIFNPDGTIREYQSVGRDVTDLKTAEEELLKKNEELSEMYEELTATEEELRQNYDELLTNQKCLIKSEERNSALIGALPDMMVTISREGYYQGIYIPEDGEFYPYSKDLVGKHIRETGLDKETTTAILHRLDLAIRTGKTQQFEYSVAHPDQKRIYEARLTALSDDEGVAIVQDITRRVATETILRENERKLNAIVQGSPIPFFVIDRDHTVIHWNRTLEQYTGIRTQDIVGTNKHLTAFYPDGRPSIADYLVNGSLKDISHEYGGKLRKSQILEDAYEIIDFFPNFRKKDGSGAWLFLTAAPIRDTDGRIIGAIETVEDITEEKVNEDARKQALKKLNLLSQITRHDILNQLTVLSGYLEVTKLQSENPKLLDYIRKEEIATKTIQRQIAFTRDYQNIGIHSPTWENTEQVISRVKSTLQPENKEIDVSFKNLEIYADPLLEKVFYNLIENALRHGGVVSKITFSEKENQNGLTVICEDDGVGVPKSEKENIFQRKFYKNTGFGLFLSREILQITGLTIRETGEQGKGARFEIDVPKGAYRFSD